MLILIWWNSRIFNERPSFSRERKKSVEFFQETIGWSVSQKTFSLVRHATASHLWLYMQSCINIIKPCAWLESGMVSSILLCLCITAYSLYQGRTKWRNPRPAHLMLCNRVGWENFHYIKKVVFLGIQQQPACSPNRPNKKVWRFQG